MVPRLALNRLYFRTLVELIRRRSHEREFTFFR
jgi:hypothetical protein